MILQLLCSTGHIIFFVSTGAIKPPEVFSFAADPNVININVENVVKNVDIVVKNVETTTRCQRSKTFFHVADDEAKYAGKPFQSCAQFYKTFYSRNLRMFLINSLQAFLA